MIDLYGRQLDAIVTASQVAAMMLQDIKTFTDHEAEVQKTRDDRFTEIVDLLKQLNESFTADQEEVEAEVAPVLDAAASVNPAESKNVEQRNDKIPSLMLNLSKQIRTHAKNIDNNVGIIVSLLKATPFSGESKKPTFQNPSVVEPPDPLTANTVIQAASTGVVSVRPPGGTGTAASGAGGGGVPPTTGNTGGSGDADNLNNSFVMIEGVLSKFSRMSHDFLQGIELDLMKVFRGVVTDSFRFVKNMRMVSFTSRQWSEDTQDVARQWIEFGEQAKETGYSRAIFQDLLQRESQKGLLVERKEIMRNGKMEAVFQRRSIKDQQRMLKTAMNTATMIGSSVDQTAEMFSEWQRNLALSNAELNSMSDSMKSIAHTTGISGDNLLEAARSSQTIFKELRKTGALSAESMANVTQTMALFRKYGIEEKGSEIMQAMSSRLNFFKADPALQSLLYRSAERGGVMPELMGGSITQSRESMGKMFKGISDSTLDILQGGMLPTLTDLKDLPKLLEQLDLGVADATYGDAAQQKYMAGNVRTFMEQNLHLPPGELDSLLKVMEENRSPLEKMQELMQERDRRRAEGDDLTDLNKRIQETQTAVDTERLNIYMSSMKNATDIGDAMRLAQGKMQQQKLGDFNQADLATTVQSMSSNMQAEAKKLGIEGKLQSTLNESQFKSFDQLAAGLQSKDIDVAKEAGEVFNSLQNQLEIAQKKGSDPLASIQQDVTEINDKLGKIVGSWVMRLTKTVLLGIVGVAAAGTLSGPALSLFGMLRGLKSWMGKAATLGGGGAAGGAGGASSMAAAGEGAAAAGGLGTKVMGFGGKALGVLGKLAGPLTLLVGGLKGWMESSEAGMSGLEGGIFGMLTGGAKTGSGFIGDMLGIEKGTTLDKGVGVLESAGWGAGIGAMIGSVVPVIGTGIGAAVGAALGGVAELIKIYWGPIKEAIGYVLQPLGEALSYVWTELGNLLNWFGDTAKAIGSAIWPILKPIFDVAKGIGGLLASIVTSLPILQTIRAAFGLVGQTIMLAVDAVKVFLKFITGDWSGAWDTLKKAFSRIGKWFVRTVGDIFGNLPSTIWSALSGLGTIVSNAFWGAMNLIGTTLKNLPGIIGRAILALPGIIWDFLKSIPQRIMDALSGLGGMIQGAMGNIGSFLGDALHAAFIDLPMWIIGGIGAAIQNLPGMLKTVFIDFPVWVIGALGEVIQGLPGMLKAVFIDFPMWILSGIGGALLGIGEKIGELLKTIFIDLPTMIGQAIWNTLTQLPGVLMNAFMQIPEMIGGALRYALTFMVDHLPLPGFLKDMIKNALGLNGQPGQAAQAEAKPSTPLEQKVQENVQRAQKEGYAQSHADPTNPAKAFWDELHGREAQLAMALGKMEQTTQAGDSTSFSDAAKETLTKINELNTTGAKKGLATRMFEGHDVWNETIKSIEEGASKMGVTLDAETQSMLADLKQRVSEDDLQTRLRTQVNQRAARVNRNLTPEEFNTQVAELRAKELRGNIAQEVKAKDAARVNATAENLLSDMSKQKTRFGSTGIDQWTETIQALRGAQAEGIKLSPEVERGLLQLEGRSRQEFTESNIRQDMIKQGYFPGAEWGKEKRKVSKEEFTAHVKKLTEERLKAQGFNADGTKAEKAADATVHLTEEATKPGSIYVHDIHSEKILTAILAVLTGQELPSNTVEGLVTQIYPQESGEASYAAMGAFDLDQPEEAMDQAFVGNMAAIAPEPVGDSLMVTNKLLESILKAMLRIEGAEPVHVPGVHVPASQYRPTFARTTVHNAPVTAREYERRARAEKYRSALQEKSEQVNSVSSGLQAITGGVSKPITDAIGGIFNVLTAPGRMIGNMFASDPVIQNATKMITENVDGGTISSLMNFIANPIQAVSSLINGGSSQENQSTNVDSNAQNLGLFDLSQGSEAISSAETVTNALWQNNFDSAQNFDNAVINADVIKAADLVVPNYTMMKRMDDRTPGGMPFMPAGYGANYATDVRRFERDVQGLTENTSVSDVYRDRLSQIMNERQSTIGHASPMSLGLFDQTLSTEAIDEAYKLNESRMQMMGLFNTHQGTESLSSVSTEQLLESMFSTRKMLMEALPDAQRQRQTEMFAPYTSMQSMGIFDPNLSRDALDESDNVAYQNFMMSAAGFSAGHPSVTGLGTPLGATAESERLREVIEKKKMAEEAKRMATVLNQGLFDESNVKETADETITSLTRYYGRNLNTIFDRQKPNPGAAALSKSLYYTDEQNAQVSSPSNYYEGARGSVSTNLLAMGDAEQYVSRMVEGEKPTGAGVLIPGLDTMVELMEEANAREEKMLAVLEQIRDSKARRSSIPLDPEQPGRTAFNKSGIRNWSRDIVRGFWTETMSGTYSEQTNHTGDIRH